MANTAVIDNLRRNIQNIGNVKIQQKIKEQDRKAEFQDAIKKALATSAMSGRVRPKAGADFNNLDLENPDFGQVLGKLGGLYEAQPAKVSSSVTSTQVPFSDIMTAHSVLGASPESLAEKGLATENPRNMLQKVLGFFTGAKPKYTTTPEFDSMQESAANLIKNPTRTTTRMTGGQVLGMGGDQSSDGSFTPEQESTIQENMDAYPDKSREEVITALQANGSL